jgi:hypothetical protein
MTLLLDTAKHLAPELAAGLLFWLLAGLINWATWEQDHVDWERWAGTNPKKALFVRLLRAWGPHLRKGAEAWRDYAEAQAARRGMPVAPPPAAPADPAPKP